MISPAMAQCRVNVEDVDPTSSRRCDYYRTQTPHYRLTLRADVIFVEHKVLMSTALSQPGSVHGAILSTLSTLHSVTPILTPRVPTAT